MMEHDEINTDDVAYTFPESIGDMLAARPRSNLAFFRHENDPDMAVALLPSMLNAALVAEGRSPVIFIGDNTTSNNNNNKTTQWRPAVGAERLVKPNKAPPKDLMLILVKLGPDGREDRTRSRQEVFFSGQWTHHVHDTNPERQQWVRRCDPAVFENICCRHHQYHQPALMGFIMADIGIANRGDPVLATRNLVLLDSDVHGTGRYSVYIGAGYHLMLDVDVIDTGQNSNKTNIIGASLLFAPQANQNVYIRTALPSMHDGANDDDIVAAGKCGGSGRDNRNAIMSIGVNVQVYRSNYMTIREKAEREVVLADASISKTRDDLEKAEKDLKTWERFAIGEATKEKEAQEAATVMTPPGLVSQPDTADDAIRERLERRIEETDEQLVDAATKLKTTSRTLSKLKKQAALYAAGRRRQLIINRARGLRGLRIQRLQATQGDVVIKRFQSSKKEYNALKKRRETLKKDLAKVQEEREKLYEEARKLAKERLDRGEALRDKRERADEADLDFKIQRGSLEERRLEEAERARKEVRRTRQEASEAQEEALREQQRQREVLERQRRETERSRQAAELQAEESTRQRELLEDRAREEAENRRLREEIERLRRQQEAREERVNQVLVPGTAATRPLLQQVAASGAIAGMNTHNGSDAEMTMLRYQLQRMEEEQRIDKLKQEEERRMQGFFENEKRRKERDEELARLTRLEQAFLSKTKD